MYNLKKILAFYLETSMHPGTGSVVNSTVDLPIQRETTTKFPFIQSSSIKGNLKNLASNLIDQEDLINKIFGESDSRGSMVITDGKLLLFPIRSLDKVFCWITCPLILHRFSRDLEIIGKSVNFEVQEIMQDNIALSFYNESSGERLLLENYVFKIKEYEKKNELIEFIENLLPASNTYKYIKNRLDRNLFIVNDKIFTYLVNTETEIIPRIKIDQEKGVTVSGALFYEEYLPKDTLLYSMLFYNDDANSNIEAKVNLLDGKVIQLGGNLTIGKGFTIMKLLK